MEINDTNIGDAVIYIDMNGNTLPGFFMVTSSNGKRNMLVNLPYIEVKVSLDGSNIRAEITKITPSLLEPEKEVLWTYSGNEDYSSLPEKLDKYGSALNAAISKAHGYKFQQFPPYMPITIFRGD